MLGHATFLIATPGGKKILVDPWVANNPMTPATLKSFDQVDVLPCAFPLLTGTPQDLERRIEEIGIELDTLKLGETLS